jgi:protein TonB
MKRILYALGLSAGIHGLLFYLVPPLVPDKSMVREIPKHLTVTLSHLPLPMAKPDIRSTPSAKPLEVKKSEPKPSVQNPEREKRIEPAAEAQEPITDLPAQNADMPISIQEAAPSKPVAAQTEKTSAPAALPATPAREATPMYRLNPPPEYPGIAKKRGLEGTVVLDVFVEITGEVSELRVYQPSGHPVLDRAALASVRTWVFEPGMKGDKPVAMWVRVPIRFRLE